jgi:pimeloyl-ACP methyl ester carboxylesterase
MKRVDGVRIGRLLALLCLLSPAWLWAADGQFRSGGVVIGYSDVGNPAGEPVILVHGYVVNSVLQWTLPGITKSLSKDYRVILFDNRGHGRSGRPTEPEQYGMEMIHDVARLMDHLQIKKAHIVGYSMGAFIAHKFAAAYPERVKSIVLGGAGWLREGPQTAALDEISDSLLKKKSLEPLFRSLHPADARPLEEEDVKRVNTMALLINDSRALAAVAKGMKAMVLSEDEIKHITQPTLCVVGERDPLCESARMMENVRPHLKMVYVPGATHMNTYNLPVFREKIEQFLDEQKRK